MSTGVAGVEDNTLHLLVIVVNHGEVPDSDGRWTCEAAVLHGGREVTFSTHAVNTIIINILLT